MNPDTLRRAWEAKPDDVTAAVAWAKAQARGGDPTGAVTTLNATQRAVCPDPLTRGREAAHDLSRLMSARFEAGFSYEEVRCRELLGWAPRQVQSGWRVRAEAGWVWRAAHLCADRWQVIAQQSAASEYVSARLVALETATGRALWSAARDGSLMDARFWGHEHLLVTWWERASVTLEVRRRDTGKVEGQATLDAPCWRRSLVGLGGARVGALMSGADGGPWLGTVDVGAMATRWEPLVASASTARALAALAPRHGAVEVAGLGAFGARLGLPYELLTLWRDTHGDEHLVFGWLIEHLRGESARLHNRLWRVRGDRMEEVALPARWQHEPVAPRFYRVGEGWVGTLQGHQLRVERSGQGPRVFPLGPLSGALPEVWTLRDDGARVEAVALGHAGAHDAALTSGGAWWQVRMSPARLSAYGVAARGAVKQAVSVPLASVSAEVGASRGVGWSRPPALAALHVVPLGPWLLQVCPTLLACDGLG